MKKRFTLRLAAACSTATAQSDIDYPYNPDFENDGFVGIEDVLELLSVYGTPFTPEQLLLDGASLTDIIESLQSQIDSLASHTNEGLGAIALNDSLLTEYLVGVAAASEEGDSTLGAWVMQLSEVVEQQQLQIDSLASAFVDSPAADHTQFAQFNAGDTIVVEPYVTELIIETDALVDQYVVYHVSYVNSVPTGIYSDTLTSYESIMEFLATGDFMGGVQPVSGGEIYFELGECQSDHLTVRFDKIFDTSDWHLLSEEIHDANFELWYNSWSWQVNQGYPLAVMCDGCSMNRRVAELQQSHRAFGSQGDEYVWPTECQSCFPSVATIDLVRLTNGWSMAH